MNASRRRHRTGLVLAAIAAACTAKACTFDVPPPYNAISSSSSATSSSSGAGGNAPCASPLSSCPNLSGCFDILGDSMHCGSACSVCSEPGSQCITGVCGCPAKTNECSNPPGCYDPSSDAAHCGNCMTSCMPSETCSSGHCCASAKIYCGTPVGGCFDPMSTDAHCGDCMNACAADRTCATGKCVCVTGKHACPGTTTCFPDGDSAHCGPTCATCAIGGMCANNACGCPSPETDCNGTCTDTNTDASNCGACGNVCSTPLFPNAQCSNGHCQPAVIAASTNIGILRAAAADPTTSPTELYAIADDSNATAWHFGESVAPTSVNGNLNGVFGAIELAAYGGNLAYGYAVMTSGALWNGPFSSLSAGPSSNAGFTMVTSIGPTFYYAYDTGSGNCVKKGISSPTNVICLMNARATALIPEPQDPTEALLHPISSGGTQGQVQLVSLTMNQSLATYTTFPIPQDTSDSVHSIATNGTGSVFYYVGIDNSAGNVLGLYRYDVTPQTNQKLFSFGNATTTGAALLRDGSTLYWITDDLASPETAHVYRAATAALDAIGAPDPQGVAVLLASFPATGVWSVSQDATALYFIDNYRLYRERK